jgi:aspartate racemase
MIKTVTLSITPYLRNWAEIFLNLRLSNYLDVMNKLKDRGAEGIIMGCTEIPLLISPDDIDILLFDTAQIHSNAAVEFALG